MYVFCLTFLESFLPSYAARCSADLFFIQGFQNSVMIHTVNGILICFRIILVLAGDVTSLIQDFAVVVFCFSSVKSHSLREHQLFSCKLVEEMKVQWIG